MSLARINLLSGALLWKAALANKVQARSSVTHAFVLRVDFHNQSRYGGYVGGNIVSQRNETAKFLRSLRLDRLKNTTAKFYARRWECIGMTINVALWNYSGLHFTTHHAKDN